MENTTQKKISVIIPTHNVESYIPRLTKNLEDQTIGIEDLDIIFVDDCSTDQTLSLLQDFQSKYKDNVRVLIMEKRVMQGYCRNFALGWATGDYIAFLDSDDTMQPEAFELLYNKAYEYNADLVIFKWKEEGGAPGPTGTNFFTEIKTSKDRRDFYVNHKDEITRACWDKLYKRELVNKYNLRFAEKIWDEEPLFTTPALMAAERIYYLNYILYNYNTKREDSSAHQMTKDNTGHKLDNAIAWAHTYNRIRDLGMIEPNYELFEWWFTVNFFYLTWSFNKSRKYDSTTEEILLLYSMLLERFPNWQNNKIIKDRGYVNKIRDIVKGAMHDSANR